MTAVMWFRRDLRLADNPAFAAAAADGEVLPLFVVDPGLTKHPGRRLARLAASLEALDESLDGALVVRHGNPADVVPWAAEQAGAQTVHVSEETTGLGRRRDRRVQRALDETGVDLVATGSPYAVTPGTIAKGDGTPYKVFTPFSKAWRDHGWQRPFSAPPTPRWVRRVDSQDLPQTDIALPESVPVGEEAALKHWRHWRDHDLADYADTRDWPGQDNTSRLSAFFKYGELHPRTVLADLDPERDAAFMGEICWREFYADVLLHHPTTTWEDLNPLGLEMDDPGESKDLLSAWQEGRTGYPIVDAGMRQLVAEGFMHNRVRMIVASFLTKDLHLPWQVGADHFMRFLLDGDPASNSHGWQWMAGTGTDAAPYFRVFNPTLQGQKFDPQGEYVKRWIPELRHLTGKKIHEPWKVPDGHAHGYPEPIVDHKQEREICLARYAKRTR